MQFWCHIIRKRHSLIVVLKYSKFVIVLHWLLLVNSTSTVIPSKNPTRKSFIYKVQLTLQMKKWIRWHFFQRHFISSATTTLRSGSRCSTNTSNLLSNCRCTVRLSVLALEVRALECHFTSMVLVRSLMHAFDKRLNYKRLKYTHPQKLVLKKAIRMPSKYRLLLTDFNLIDRTWNFRYCWVSLEQWFSTFKRW